MWKNSIIDYLGFILLKALGPLIRLLPESLSLSFGRALGAIYYAFDLKHKAVSYSNIKKALGHKSEPSRIRRINRDFYRAFGQNIIEIFFIPKIDKKYIDKHVTVEGIGNIHEAFKRGKGLIFVAVHAGSWELANVISANFDFAFSIFVREQKFPHLEGLLNSYRKDRGCRIIERENQTRRLIEVLKSNEAIAITLDQGGKDGVQVSFFGKNASMASGAVRLALKYGCSLIPIFPARIKGPNIKFFVGQPFSLKQTGDTEKDVRDNLQELIHIFEGFIEKYPHEYLWSYKIWKYSSQKNILILSDGKAGHLRQSEALAKIVAGYYKEKAIDTDIKTIEVGFKNNISRMLMVLSGCLSGRYICQGCLFCLKTLVPKQIYGSLISQKPDIVISCGSGLVPVNYLISRENHAKSFIIMRPSIFHSDRFDLVVQPKHDNPPGRKNIVVTDVALNLIDEKYLQDESEKLCQQTAIKKSSKERYIGVLIGGNTKQFRLKPQDISEVLRQLKSAARKLDCRILVSTSRRTPPQIETLIKNELKSDDRCGLLIIANEKNYPFAVGGILGLSDTVIASPESISMISEAVNSRKHVVIFGEASIKGRHKAFLQNLLDKHLIHSSEPYELARTLESIRFLKPGFEFLRDNEAIREALKKIL
jgi:KDO2-lipid IV(A) lauroyltransferase